jgi:hypothetical protein
MALALRCRLFMEWLLALLCPAFIGLFVVGIVFSRRGLSRLKDTWAAYASARGARFVRGSDGIAPSLPRVHVVCDGVPIELWLHYVRRRNAYTRYTTATAPCAPGLPAFTVHSGSPPGFFDKLFGTQDIQVGDPLFDNWFVVRGPNPDAIRRAVSPRVQRLLLAHRGAIRCDGRKVSFTWLGYEENVDALDRGVQIAALLARGG